MAFNLDPRDRDGGDDGRKDDRRTDKRLQLS